MYVLADGIVVPPVPELLRIRRSSVDRDVQGGISWLRFYGFFQNLLWRSHLVDSQLHEGKWVVVDNEAVAVEFNVGAWTRVVRNGDKTTNRNNF